MLALFFLQSLAILVGLSTALIAPTGSPSLKRGLLASEYTSQGYLTCFDEIDWDDRILSSAFNEEGFYAQTDGDDLLRVEIDLATATTKPVKMRSLPDHWYTDFFKARDSPFVGAISAVQHQHNINSSSKVGVLMLGATSRTDRYAIPVAGKNSAADVNGFTHLIESAIWRYKPGNRELYPQWINPDESIPDLAIYYDQGWNGFVMGPASAQVDMIRFSKCRLTFNPL